MHFLYDVQYQLLQKIPGKHYILLDCIAENIHQNLIFFSESFIDKPDKCLDCNMSFLLKPHIGLKRV